MTYADTCIERADGATEGPWKKEHPFYEEDDLISVFNSQGVNIVGDCCIGYSTSPEDVCTAEFIAHSRTAVPELARRLKRVCEEIRAQAQYFAAERYNDKEARRLNTLADELEAMPENK